MRPQRPSRDLRTNMAPRRPRWIGLHNCDDGIPCSPGVKLSAVALFERVPDAFPHCQVWDPVKCRYWERACAVHAFLMLCQRSNNDEPSTFAHCIETLRFVVGGLLSRAGRRSDDQVLRQSHAAGIGSHGNTHDMMVHDSNIALTFHSWGPGVQT